MRSIKKKQVSQKIELNLFQIAALAYAFDKNSVTIQRWAKSGHYALTTPAAQKLIDEYKIIPSLTKINEYHG